MRRAFYASIRGLWLPLLALFSASLATAQFAEFAAPGNGSKLYFSSSLPLQGSGESQQGRIFSVDASGVHTVADVLATMPTLAPSGVTTFTSYYGLSRPELSRDGAILIYSGARSCSGTPGCAFGSVETLVQTTITTLPSGVVKNVLGTGRISGNGRYLLLRVQDVPDVLTLLDLQTGQSQALAPTDGLSGVGRIVADNGTIVYGLGRIVIAGTAGPSPISSPDAYADQPVIDSAAHTVVYVQFDYSTNLHTIHAYSTDRQKDLLLFAQGDCTAPYVSADGKLTMFISSASGSPQAWVVNTDATGAHQVTSDPTGVLRAALSDDGTTIWYLSGSGRVSQVNLNSGTTREMIGRTPNLSGGGSPSVVMSPGSVWTLEGAGFSDSTYRAANYPLPRELGGVSVMIGGVSAPIVSVAPTEIVLQVPWETPAGNSSRTPVNVQVKVESASPFIPLLTQTFSAAIGNGFFVHGPEADVNGSYYALAVHQDWSALVTVVNPARPNEIVHLYGLNLGPVTSPPPTGMPAPDSPLSPTKTPIACELHNDNTTTTVPVLFAGLAPGVVGYYQLDLRLPASNLLPETGFFCTVSGSDSSFFGIIPTQ